MPSRVPPVLAGLPFAGLLLAGCLLVGAPPALGEEEGALPRWQAGEQKGEVEIAGRMEAFVALVPKGYTPRKKWPIVLLAHGNGGTAADFLRAVKPFAGKKPPLLVSLERCDNGQDAVGYVPKYLDALKAKFSLDEEHVYALGFSGGGFRLWDDVVCQAAEVARFRGVILVGSAKQSFDPPEKPEKAATVLLVGDPNDTNFGQHRVDAEAALKAKGYEVIVHEHAEGHSLARKPMEAVFAWIADTLRPPRSRPPR